MNYEKQNILGQPNLVLTILEETFNIHRLPPDASLPEEISECDFYSLSKTADELSLVCPEYFAVKSEKSSLEWKSLKVAGPLEFTLTGILAGITAVLAKEKNKCFCYFYI